MGKVREFSSGEIHLLAPPAKLWPANFNFIALVILDGSSTQAFNFCICTVELCSESSVLCRAVSCVQCVVSVGNQHSPLQLQLLGLEKQARVLVITDLSADKTAADFIVKNSLNADEAHELAKAIKDHERRPQGREVRTLDDPKI
ncbi:hypothetical protein R1flu_026169 [Riccia fluitans]|uniref:Uncharacterized protein n=1 Tax=Riccia fluitans TaxID=41844 RepID=A0ABD1XF72_9MARC